MSLISLVDPSFHSGAITCGTFPTPPPEAKMKEDEAEFQPIVMCPDEAVRYVCDAGGINVLKVRIFLQSLHSSYKPIVVSE